MNKPKGVPCIVCDCVPGGWPLYLWQDGTRQDREHPDLVPNDVPPHLVCKAVGVKRSADRQHILGCCPQCNHLFQLSMGSDAVQWDDERFYRAMNPLPEDVIIREPYTVRVSGTVSLPAYVEATSLHIRIVHRSPPINQSGAGTTLVESVGPLPSRRGGQSLRLDSRQKRRFYEAWKRRYSAGLKVEEMPDWYPQASDKQFEEWAREINRKIMDRGILPDYEVKRG